MTDDPASDVAAAARRAAAARAELDGAVARARRAGLSWNAIGKAAGGMSKQAAHERWHDLPMPIEDLEELAAYYDTHDTSREMEAGLEWVDPRISS